MNLPHSPELKPSGRLASLVWGAALPYRAARTIAGNPRLAAWSIAPALLTLTAFWFGFTQLFPWLRTAFARQAHAWGFGSGITSVIVLVAEAVLLVLAILSFSGVAVLIASPFNDFLAEAAEKHGAPPLPPAPRGGVRLFFRILRIDLGKAIASLAFAVLALAFSWVPILDFLAVGLGALLLTYQYISYPQTRRGLGLRDSLVFIRRHLFASFGFGFALLALFAIPLLGALALPVAVVGGTLLVARAPGNSTYPPLR